MTDYPYYGDRGNMMNGFGGFGQRQNPGQYMNLPQHRIIHVNGENGARAFRMAPNCDALLLDDTAPLVWLVQTDGAGYTTVTPYTVSPYQPETPADVRGLEERIKKLEEMIYAKSDSGDAVRSNDGDGRI